MVMMLALAGCTGPGSKDGDGVGTDCEGLAETELAATCACAEAAVEVGSGDTTYEALAEGSALTMVHGPQGGWHMLGGARFSNLYEIVSIHYTIEIAADGTVISDNNYRVQMVMDGECTGFYPGMYGYLDVTALEDGAADTPPELLGGVGLILRMEVTDLEGRITADTLGVVAALDPADVDDGGDSGDGGSGGDSGPAE